MPTMRRSTRTAKAQQQQQQQQDVAQEHKETTANASTNGVKASGDWSASSTSPLSSLSTPASSAATTRPRKQQDRLPRQSSRRLTRTSSAAANQTSDSDSDRASEEENDSDASAKDADSNNDEEEEQVKEDAVNELLTKAARAIRDQVSNGQFSPGGEPREGTAGALKRKGSANSRDYASTNKRRSARVASLNHGLASSVAASEDGNTNDDDGDDNNGEPEPEADADDDDDDDEEDDESGASQTVPAIPEAKTPTNSSGMQRESGPSAIETPTRRPVRIQQSQQLAQPQQQQQQPQDHQQQKQLGGMAMPPGFGSATHPPLTPLTPMANGGAHGSDAEDDEELGLSEDEETEKDPEGEAKIDALGYLQGGREFICPVFRSPFRRNKERQYILTMDCCRFTGARDSYMLFKQHSRMRRVETTQRERDLLAANRMIPKVTRFRPIAMITARTAFREFGARIVKNGRYIVDDYWVAARRSDARYPEGTLVADMGVYQKVMAAYAAGVTPGSTRKARKLTPLRSPQTADPSAGGALSAAYSDSRPGTPAGLSARLGSPAGVPATPGAVVNSWVQIENQQRMQRAMMLGSPTGPAAGLAPGIAARPGSMGLTMASALHHTAGHGHSQGPIQAPAQAQTMPQFGLAQHPPQQAPMHLLMPQQPGIESDVADAEDAAAAKLALLKPVFRKMRAAETAEAAFDAAVAVHRSHFSDDRGFLDGLPLFHSLAQSWPRTTSVANKIKQRRSAAAAAATTPASAADGAGTGQADGEADAGGEDLFSPMAYASSKMAGDFNASVRLWREDNGGTWVDPHTGIRQVPANMQPTRASVERIDTQCTRWRRAGKTKIDPLVSFSDHQPTEEDACGGASGGAVPSSSSSSSSSSSRSGARNTYPLALLPGQYQDTFPIHRTRFGQTYSEAMRSYSQKWHSQWITQQMIQEQHRKLAQKRLN
ncbi:hypothetical protein GGI07_001371 [Coemansia sp. Benny D115]|nr:hypothetical protein GGI07_001371 [Coemansia sp. Benny D115]